MPTTQQGEQQKHLEHDKREALHALIGEQVLHTLGSPSGLLKVQVRLIWENNYRVNVFIGADVASGKVANSYFVKTDSDGNITASSPPIAREYEV